MLGVLVTQDLSVGLIMGALPVFRSSANLSRAILHTATAAAATAAALLLLRLSLPFLAGAIRASNAHELNVLFPLGVCLAAGTFTDNLGISIELGSFAAGLVWTRALPGTASHAVELLEPIRHTFGALFFFAIGMVISPSFLLAHLGELLLLALLALTIKLAVAAPLVRVFGYSWGLSLRCAAGLAHMGEFGFLIASRGRSLGLLEQDAYLLLVGTTAVSLLTSPVMLGLVLRSSRDDAANIASSIRQAELTPLTATEGGLERVSNSLQDDFCATSCSPVTTSLASIESLSSLLATPPIT
jgi:CPA2 family monovalent cation:H+ antiporter-2